MAKKAVKKSKRKKRAKKITKGLKAFFIVLAMLVATMALYVTIDQVNKAINLSKVMMVQVDMELGGAGDGPGHFKEPCDIAIAPDDSFYVSDFSAHDIQKFDAQGQPVATFGKEGKAEGQFEQPSGLFYSEKGDLYVCDTFNHRIQKLDSNGKVLKVWSHGFFGPRSVAGNNHGRIYVTDTGNHKVQVFDEDGNFIMEWGGFGTADGKFREPVGCAVDDAGFVYVADSDNLRIQKFDPNGKFIGAFKVATWQGKNVEVPYLCVRDGFLYASNAGTSSVLKYDLSGKLIAIYKRKEGFQGAAGVAMDHENRIWVVEKAIAKIARFTVPSASQK